MATPVSGTITMFDINSAFNRGNNLNAYRGTVWYQPNSLVTGTFPAGQIAFSDFYNKTGTNPAPPSPPTPTTFGPGTYTFVVPLFRNQLTVQLSGGGGGGGGDAGSGAAGGASVFYAPTATLIAGGGGGGYGMAYPPQQSVGAGGTASGGSINASGVAASGINGGNSATGGAGGTGGVYYFLLTGRLSDVHHNVGTSGGLYGGGGGATNHTGGKFYEAASGGGGGAYASQSYTPSQLPAGSSITLVVGAGGVGADSGWGGQPLLPSGSGTIPASVAYGGNGLAQISWT